MTIPPGCYLLEVLEPQPASPVGKGKRVADWAGTFFISYRVYRLLKTKLTIRKSSWLLVLLSSAEWTLKAMFQEPCQVLGIWDKQILSIYYILLLYITIISMLFIWLGTSIKSQTIKSDSLRGCTQASISLNSTGNYSAQPSLGTIVLDAVSPHYSSVGLFVIVFPPILLPAIEID